jgi:hypothetical protein
MERFIESLLGWQRPEWPLLPYSAAAFQWMSPITIFLLAAVHKDVTKMARRQCTAGAARG